jgi:hypothetical protein
MIALAMGWIGTVGSIAAYVLLSRGTWSATSLRYSALNGLAGIVAGCASAAYGAWPSVGSNLLWTGIAAHSALTTLRTRRRAHLSAVETAPANPDPEPPAQSHPVLAAA